MSTEFVKQSEINHISKKTIRRKTAELKNSNSPILQMQQSLGNQTILQLLRSGALQTKLTVGKAGDQYEQEADQVADQVMRMPDPDIQRQALEKEEDELQMSSLAGVITPFVQREEIKEDEEPVQAKFLVDNQSMIQKSPPEEEPIQGKFISNGINMLQKQSPEEEEEKPIQAKESSDAGAVSDSGLESSIQNLRGGGVPLPDSVRNYFEPRFGYDFGQVRVHHDSSAAETTQALNAKAYTLGHDVVFGSGQYAPEHEDGKKLIAHELTHVVQQNG